MRRLGLMLILLYSSLSAFVETPWMREPWYFDFLMEYKFQYFAKVDNGVGAENKRNISHWFYVDFVAPLFSNIDVETEIEFNQATSLTSGLESIGIQGRKLWLNGIAGDPLTITTPINIRLVPKNRLESVVTPYHNVFNIEGGCSIGKEFSKGGSWIARLASGLFLGTANTGSPWLNSFILGEFKRGEFIFGTKVYSYIGFGSNIIVDVDNFDGYGNIKHRSIDVDFFVKKQLGLWGNLDLMYNLRAFARSYPEQLTSFSIAYDIGFSF